MHQFNGIIQYLSSLMWGPFTIALLFIAGIYLTAKIGFLQLFRFPTVMAKTLGSLFKSNKNKNATVTPFQAVATALASTLGVGNIAGIATAITLGGAGAVFWMWVGAFFGMATKLCEIVLAINFRVKDKNGVFLGGPMLYIERGLKFKAGGIFFAIVCILSSLCMGNLTQTNTISASLAQTFKMPPVLTGILIAIVVGIILKTGTKGIVRVNEKVVPFMAITFTLACIFVIFKNIELFPKALAAIFEGAFSFKSVASGGAGLIITRAMRTGLSRGVFSNEAGLGSAPIAHASAETKDAVNQGLWGITEVFIDTFLSCTLTAFAILVSPPVFGLTGAALTGAAFQNAFGGFGSVFCSFSIVLFSLSTVIGWSFYGERCLCYLSSNSKNAFGGYKVIYVACCLIGAIIPLETVWSLSDFLNGLMMIPNLIAVMFLSKPVIEQINNKFKSNKKISKIL